MGIAVVNAVDVSERVKKVRKEFVLSETELIVLGKEGENDIIALVNEAAVPKAEGWIAVTEGVGDRGELVDPAGEGLEKREEATDSDGEWGRDRVGELAATDRVGKGCDETDEAAASGGGVKAADVVRGANALPWDKETIRWLGKGNGKRLGDGDESNRRRSHGGVVGPRRRA